MDIEKMSRNNTGGRNRVDVEDEEDVPLPGFRFHPTDEELVGFYLRRKVEKIAISIELIKTIDMYKYDPWDLPKGSNVGDKEWYFFCKRGRKYRNSIRPNRVTGSGFWKATGIDRPIYSVRGEGRTDCIGLKKSLVYYRGSAGKGTKTDWMMHEFRLPPDDTKTNNDMDTSTNNTQEAEVWTLCRILKRSVSHKKCLPDWRQLSSKRNPTAIDTSSKTCSGDSDHNLQSYISFQAPSARQNNIVNYEQKPFGMTHTTMNGSNQLAIGQFSSSSSMSQAPSPTSCSSFRPPGLDVNEFIKHGDWDDLRSVVEYAAAADQIYFM